ncbi:hypothetical protein OAK92_01810 [Crocinitomicaceae bacterium]|nr:hypothetical protein [Crocinitomicaceae bacterium]
MTFRIYDRVKETSTTTGTGTIILNGALGAFQSFNDAFLDGQTTYYTIENGSRWEVGQGVFDQTSNSISRDIVFDSSNNNNKIDLEGVSIVFCTLPASKAFIKDPNDQVVVADLVALSEINVSGLTTNNIFNSGDYNAIGDLTLGGDITVSGNAVVAGGLEIGDILTNNIVASVEDNGDVVIEKKDNQIILSGTAYYDFNHFAEYWKKWKAIINSQGKKSRLREIFGEDPPSDFNWRDYSIIRVPYELLPEGFMDASQVARSKATVHAGIYQMEFGACFTRDSQGFFKRSLIEACVVEENYKDKTPIKTSDGSHINFKAQLIGDKDKKYIFGVDPASEVDNFSIVVLEVNSEHRRIVHCWTTNREEHKGKVKSGYSAETDFYSYCARKIRDLMIRFPCIHIAMDAGGGGIAVMESLHDKDKIKEGELAIWPVIDEDKPKDTDDHRGLHILEMCQFAKYDWLAEANHGMRKDFEDKVLLFPMFDSISLGIANVEDGTSTKNHMRVIGYRKTVTIT